jgi:TetR/AcrR family transcriptional repressor of nem operon
LDQIFATWKEQLADCLKEAQQQGELDRELNCSVIAGFILSGWEGAVLRAKVMKSPQPLQDFIDTIFAAVLKK